MDRQLIEEIAENAEIPVSFVQECVDNPDKKRIHGDKMYVYHGELGVFIEFDEYKFSINSVNFDSLEEVLAIKKNDPEYTLEDAFRQYHDDFFNDQNKHLYNPFCLEKEEIERIFNSVEPITAKEALTKYNENAEKRMIALRWIGAEGLMKDLEAELVDSQTIIKKQEKTIFLGDGHPDPDNPKHKDPSLYRKEPVEYEDTYELYRIAGGQLDIRDQEYIYICKMKDTSTDREYFLFVDSNVEGATEDAISAIASTLRTVDENGNLGNPLSKEDYFNLRSEA